ncbi:hypothetical protein PACILC2_22010 [Paenibacillus cisolokensis]|uniref:Thoeris anti-defense 2-like domain-containing protein n=1 Tax=Paenibacillus cisolokensis TaxID=1658519 RepID=A0ABQ4N5Z7_9BACL|nr:DUF2829 domain-containing protein [Paenibacillus cisolokensis]GIQ63633.1 hypothetical protein PACILC2_22010 [Paenibacillus cisolokensis]
MNFSQALEALKQDKKVARSGWNGKGMWLILVRAWTTWKVDLDVYLPMSWIGMKTADNKFVPWVASQTDLLAEDWLVIEE